MVKENDIKNKTENLHVHSSFSGQQICRIVTIEHSDKRAMFHYWQHSQHIRTVIVYRDKWQMNLIGSLSVTQCRPVL